MLCTPFRNAFSPLLSILGFGEGNPTSARTRSRLRRIQTDEAPEEHQYF